MFRQIVREFKRAAKNRVLASQGIGCCEHCRNHWGVVEGETIPFAPRRGMFPVCTRCFSTLSAEQIIVYVNKLVDLWASQSPDENYDEVRASAADSVRRMKQQPAA